MEFLFKANYAEANFPVGKLKVSPNEEEGVRPYQLLVSSVISCSGFVWKRILEKQRIALEDLHISAEVERDGTAVNKITEIRLHFMVKGNDLNEAKLKKSLALAHKNCSMIQSIQNSIEVVETLEIIPS